MTQGGCVLDFKYCMYGDDVFTVKTCERILRVLSKMEQGDLYLMPSLSICAVKSGWWAPKEYGLTGELLGTFDATISVQDLFEELNFAIEEACPTEVLIVAAPRRSRVSSAPLCDFDDTDNGDADCVADVDSLRILAYGATMRPRDDAGDFSEHHWN